jgi:hypothetical protein
MLIRRERSAGPRSASRTSIGQVSMSWSTFGGPPSDVSDLQSCSWRVPDFGAPRYLVADGLT